MKQQQVGQTTLHKCDDCVMHLVGIEAFLTFCETRIAEKKLDDSIASESIAESEDVPFYDIQYESLSQGSFADHAILERRDSNGMLTSEALILSRVKQLEEDHRISIQYDP